MSKISRMDDCRAFLFFLGSRPLYREKLLSSKELFCSPDAQTNLASSSRAIQTPIGGYDVAEFFSKNKLTQQPEIVLVKADASARNLPSNLKTFKCPRVLLVGDTHHMGTPIQKLLAYAKQEEFDRIIFDHTRHHARWFFEAGLKNVHWIPALDFTFHPRTPSPNPKHQFSFVGQAGKFHPYRCRVLESLQKAGLPLEMLRGTPAEAADIYADSNVTLNVSLNGDLNLRVFEALAAGGFLLTDKLSPSSGLELLFKPGEDIEVWSSVDELIEKARYYLDNPAQADRIRRSGQQKLLKFHHPDVKIREFFELVFEGKENPLYSLEEEAVKSRSSVQGVDLEVGVEAYEFFQEMHRTMPLLVVWAAEESLDAAQAFLGDLPRVLVNSAGGAILFLSGAETKPDEMLTSFEGMWVIAPKGLSERLKEWGFVEITNGVYEFAYSALRSLKLLETANAEKIKADLPEILDACTQAFQALLVADRALALEIPEVYQNALKRALFLDRNCLSALFQLADTCLQGGAEEDAAILLHEAHRIQSLPVEVNTLREELEREFAASSHFAQYKEAISGGTPPPPTTTYSILVVTNLFPPQEMGGYGRKIWEFSNGLIKRGHRLKILTGDASYLQKAPDAGEPDLEPLVERSLVLQGEWKNGQTLQLGDLSFISRTSRSNKEKVLAAVTSFKPDFVLLGNFDFLGIDILKALITEKIPVLHSLGNQTPSYHPQESIQSPLYTIAPASDWLGKNLLDQGYKVSNLSTVYPGARVDRFFKQFLPDIRRLRIAFAGLVMPYKGAHVLIDALSILKKSGIEFEADFAGDSTDEVYIRTLKEFVQNNGMAAQVRFNGFLDREGLAALFARCNVLVFPTQVPEAFGISQVEAMASGLIVITSGTGGTQEVIRHGIDGLVFEMGNAVSLAQNLTTLTVNPDLRNKLQINSQKRAMQFSVTESVVRIEKIAGEMLESEPTISRNLKTVTSQSEQETSQVKKMKSKLKYSLVDFGTVVNGDSFYNRLLSSALDVNIDYCADYSSADILVIGPYGNDKIRYAEGQTKAWRVFMTGENNRPDYKFSDCSLTFDRFENEGRNFRLPGWMYELSWFDGLPSTFTPEETEWILNKNRPLQKYLDNYESRQRKVVAVFNTLEHYRVEIFKAFSKLGVAEGVGRPFGNEQNWAGGFYRGKCELISKYLVNLCFENAIYPGYYTEKPIHSRAMGCLPLVYSDSYLSLDFNSDALVNLYNFSSQSEFVEYVRFLLLRPELIRQKIDSDIFTRKPSLDGAKEFLLKKYNEFNSK